MPPELFESPPKKRRWPWVLAGLVVALVFTIAAYRAWLNAAIGRELASFRQQGYPIALSGLQSWYGPVPDRQNAALRILEAADFLALDDNSFKHWPDRTEELGPEERDHLADLLTNNFAAFEAIRGIASLPLSRFPMDFSRGPNMLVPHLAKVKSLTQLLRAEATLYSEQGQVDRALASIQDAFGLAHSLDQEPLLISQLVRSACLSITCLSLERVLTQHALAEAQLASLAEACQKARDAGPGAFQAGYVGEACFGSYMFHARPQELGEALSSDAQSSPFVHVLWPLYTWTGLRERDYLFYLQNMRAIVEGAKTFPQDLAQVKRDEDVRGHRLEARRLLIFSRMLLPALERSAEKQVECDARLRCAQAALAVELYRAHHDGALPSDLAAPAAELARIPRDPIDGHALRFQTRKPGYLVYSIGADRVDNDGTERGSGSKTGARKRGAAGEQNSSTRGYDVTFTVER
ncbi:MAG: hypothetical protein U1G07_09460 [Verrucomicrobiota bacterium]